MNTNVKTYHWNRVEGTIYPLEMCFDYDTVEGLLLDFRGEVEGDYSLRVLDTELQNLMYTDLCTGSLSMQECVTFEQTRTRYGDTSTYQFIYPINKLNIPKEKILKKVKNGVVDYKRAMKVLNES